MQIYLLFPALRWVLRKTEGYHRWLLAAAVAYQLWLTCALHYHLGRPATGPVRAVPERRRAGLLGRHLRALRRRGRDRGLALRAALRVHPAASRHACRRIALVAGVGVAAGLGTYLIEIYGFGATPANASAVFQPIVILEALAFGWALLGAGLLWSDRGAPHRKFCAAGSASSFGIYLAHPLVLQGLLLVTGASFLGADGGWLGAVRRAPDGLEVVALLVRGGADHLRARLADRLGGTAHAGQPDADRPRVHGRKRRARGEAPWARHDDGPLPRADHGVRRDARRRDVRRRAHHQRGRAPVDDDDLLDEGRQPHQAVRGHRADRDAVEVGPDRRRAVRGRRHHQRRDHQGPARPLRQRRQARARVPGVRSRSRGTRSAAATRAATKNVNDVGFLEALVPKIDPGHTRPIYVVGYSNGGRLAYRLACTDPGAVRRHGGGEGRPDAGLRGHQAAERPRVRLAQRQVRPL